jgi:undecaprenyl diphosphate synthase
MGKVRHFGLIPDGGRRWACRQGVSLGESYSLSFEKIGEFAEEFFQSGGHCLSIYLLSKANLARKREELNAVGEAEIRFLQGAVTRLTNRFSVEVGIAGYDDLLPEPLRTAVKELPRASPSGDFRLFLCLAYDPFDELIHAANSLRELVVTKENLLSALWVPEEVDLVVRTGGAVTLSNFLPLQCAYARIVFMDRLFNDVGKGELMQAIREHEAMDLKYGS